MRLPAFIMLTMILVMLAGCGNQQQVKKPEPPIKIAVSLADMDRDENKIIKKVMESRKGKEKVDITWLDAENEQSKQAEQLEKLTEQNVKAVIIQPVNPITGPDLIANLAEKNIKVIALETLPEDVPVDAYVASDHDLTGKLLAQFVIRTARKAAGIPVEPNSADYGVQQGEQRSQDSSQDKGGSVPPESQVTGKLPLGVFLISGDSKDISAGKIVSAAKTAIQNSSEVQLLGEAVVPNSDISQIPVLLQKIVKEQGDSLQAVLATDSSLAIEAVNYLQMVGMADRVITAGVGASEEASKALAKGEHDAEIDTRPDLLGQYSFDAAVELAKEGSWQYSSETENSNYSVPSRITPVRIVETGNVYLLSQRWSGINDNNENPPENSNQKTEDGSAQESGENNTDEENSGSSKEQPKKSKLRITTQDGKIVEMDINGEIKKIESMDGGQRQESEGQEGGQQGQEQ